MAVCFVDLVYDKWGLGTDGNMFSVQSTIPVHRLNSNYNYISCTRIPETLPILNDERNFVVSLSPSRLIKYFRFITVNELKRICVYHGLRYTAAAKLEDLRGSVTLHECVPTCGRVFYIFRGRIRTRTNVEWKFTSDVVEYQTLRREDPCPKITLEYNAMFPDEDEPDSDTIESTKHLEIASDDLRLSIIDEWQSAFSTASMRRRGCAVCARLCPEANMVHLDPFKVPLHVLRNDELPEYLRPKEYNMAAYDMAILHPPGLTKKNVVGPMIVCQTCTDSLRSHAMPKFALANWLYYGHSSLPPRVKDAFNRASSFDLMLIARARASNICFRFGSHSDANPDENDDNGGTNASRSRKGIRGNVMVTPLDAARLNEVLPPDAQTIADTICAVFVGKTTPSRSTIAKLSPVLVRKSRVKTMIEFLLKWNPHYRVVGGFKGFSADNLNRLFGKDDYDKDEAVPCSMGIGHLPLNDAVESATSDYTPRNEYDGGANGILMENVGFTTGDDSPVSYRDMKLKALAHCLNGGSFISSRRGSRMIPDFDNPFLMSWLFPHLDPWGIGGFHHPKRRVPLTMDEQLSHLLQVDGGRFEKDPEFAFVYYNIKQKKMISQNVRFRVPQSRYSQIIQDLLDVDVNRIFVLQTLFKADPMYRPVDEQESALIRLLANVSMVGNNIPGSTAYKVSLRNEIRAVINYRGTPTLFVTLNPSDVDHPLVRLNAGHDIDLDDISRGEDLDKWGRMMLAAKNPSACALFFHSMISGFVDIILRARSGGRGLLGTCTSYYGSVEANGRGTLHCHMLIWLKGHPSPQILRDRMIASSDYKEKTFKWLESIIKCELLGTEDVVVETSGALPRPKRVAETGDPHPGTIPAPLVKNMTSIDQFRRDFEGFVNSLVKEYNWHVHTASCWKHLGRRQLRDDHNCRMGMDGHILAETMLDPETASILLRRLHPRIASYNDVIMFLLKCNVDVKFIGSGEAAQAYLYYITDYITKPSLPVHVGLAALSYAIKQTNSRFPDTLEGDSEMHLEKQRGAMIITVNSMMGHQEISHQQVMSYLVGGGDHYTPDTFQTLHWSAFKTMAREFDVSRHTEGSNAGCETSDTHEPSVVLLLGKRSITASNQVFDYIYRTREYPFNSMCLYEFIETVRKIAMPVASRELIRTGHRKSLGLIAGEFSDVRHPQSGTHVLRLRTNTVIPVILGDKIPRSDRGSDEFEMWSRDVMTLFLPWRTIGDLRSGYQDWTSAYNERRKDIPSRYQRIIRNLNVLSECRDARGELAEKWREERKRDVRRFEVDEALENMLGEDEENRVNVFDTFEEYDELQDAVDYWNDSVIESELGKKNSNLLNYCLSLQDHDDNCIPVSLGDATEVLPNEKDDLANQVNAMLALKRKRRPEHDTGIEERVSQRRRLSDSDPLTHVGTVDNASEQNARKGGVTIDPRWSLVEDVVREMNMLDNPEQTRALRIMARRIIYGGPQLLMYVAGVGGTGKSHLVKALVKLFERLGRRDELLLGAPTGIAAVLIGGYTMHALSMTNPHRKSKDLRELVALWKGVRFLVIDEISMVGSLFLSQFSSRLKQAMSDDTVASGKPFGGVNVIFMGDFAQLKPPRQHSLFAHQLVDDPSFEESRRCNDICAMNGAFLWRQVNVVVKLVKNHRHREDPDYAGFLDRIRTGTSRPNSSRFVNTDCTDDLEFLRSREISRIVEQDPRSLLEFRDAPVIVGSREVRDAVNAKYVAFHARRLIQAVHVYHASDSIKHTVVSGAVRDKLWKLSSRETHDSLGRLPLFPGMRVMVTENLAFSKGIVNGLEGVIHSIKYTRDGDGNRYASVAYLKVDDANMDIPGLSVGLVPIFPETTTFEYRYKSGDAIKTLTVSRKQLPLLPAYSYTDFKSQGRTLDRAIVDLSTARGQGVYVMLSRVKSLKGIAILRWFPSTKIYQRPSEDMRNELTRVDFLDWVTVEAYGAGHL